MKNKNIDFSCFVSRVKSRLGLPVPFYIIVLMSKETKVITWIVCVAKYLNGDDDDENENIRKTMMIIDDGENILMKMLMKIS